MLEGELLKMEARVFPDQGGEPKVGGAEGLDPMKVARSLFESLV